MTKARKILNELHVNDNVRDFYQDNTDHDIGKPLTRSDGTVVPNSVAINHSTAAVVTKGSSGKEILITHTDIFSKKSFQVTLNKEELKLLNSLKL